MMRTKEIIAIFFKKSQNKNVQGKVNFRRLPYHFIAVATISLLTLIHLLCAIPNVAFLYK